MVACSTTNNGRGCQETYETASKDAGRRAAQLKALGYTVAVGTMGAQVTPLGVVRLTLVDIQPGRHADTFNLPAVDLIKWPNR